MELTASLQKKEVCAAGSFGSLITAEDEEDTAHGERMAAEGRAVYASTM